MQGILYEEPSIWLFLLVTVLHGRLGRLDDRAGHRHDLAAVLAMRRCYLFVLAGVVRFFHFALFDGTLLLAALLSRRRGSWFWPSASLGYRYTRARQMTTQYRWLYERAGPLHLARRSRPATTRRKPTNSSVTST